MSRKAPLPVCQYEAAARGQGMLGDFGLSGYKETMLRRALSCSGAGKLHLPHQPTHWPTGQEPQ